ncbi:MAG TPA: hypothetical protein DCY13_21215 [Verrucomicrobiales bacterium]|nr:hypothetical protein [Verrucomicrobiales bacterium]
MCRRFECGVLREVSAGSLSEAAALRIIARTRKLAEKVGRLLRLLGDHDESRPLTRRYQSVMRTPIDLADPEAGDHRGELMMAVHELMELAQGRFLSSGDKDSPATAPRG